MVVKNGYKFVKLPHGTQPWGVMYEGEMSDRPRDGETVNVLTKAGGRKAIRIAQHLYSVGPYHVFAIYAEPRRKDTSADAGAEAALS